MNPRARVLLLNAALGPLDYRVDPDQRVEPGSIVLAPLGPRQLAGVVWEPERMPSDAEVGDNRLRPLADVYDLPPLAAPLRRLIEWTADYYLAPRRRCCGWRSPPARRSTAAARRSNTGRLGSCPRA